MSMPMMPWGVTTVQTAGPDLAAMLLMMLLMLVGGCLLIFLLNEVRHWVHFTFFANELYVKKWGMVYWDTWEGSWIVWECHRLTTSWSLWKWWKPAVVTEYWDWRKPTAADWHIKTDKIIKTASGHHDRDHHD